MATPDIGTTISDGYSRGFERLSSTIASAAVPAGIVGVVAGLVAEAQSRATGVELGGFGGAFGFAADLDSSELVTYNLLTAVNTFVGVFVGFAALAIFAGAMHRARHGVATDVPEPGNMFGAMTAMVSLLMPKLGLLAALSVAGPLATAISGVLGMLVSVATGIALLVLSVRWIYAPVVAGAGEGERDAAYQRSESVVAGSWWGTFVICIVVGLAIGLPIVIVAGIVGWILPTVFLSAFAASAIGALGYYTLGAAALESAWSQVEAAPLDGDHATPGSPPTPPTAPAPVVPVVPDTLAPHVQPETPRNDGPFV